MDHQLHSPSTCLIPQSTVYIIVPPDPRDIDMVQWRSWESVTFYQIV